MNSSGTNEPNLGLEEEEESYIAHKSLQQTQDVKMKPHAQAHLLSPTDKCKVSLELGALNQTNQSFWFCVKKDRKKC